MAQQITIRTSIPVPSGFTRNAYTNGSFSDWIQNIDLKNSPVIRDYRGEVVRSAFYNVWGVAQMPLLFRSDLEQCADFAMPARSPTHLHFMVLTVKGSDLVPYDSWRHLKKLR